MKKTNRIKNQKHCLITGGAGFIGSELTKNLLAKGHHVSVFDNLSFGKKEHIWKGIHFVKGDLRKPNDVKKLSPWAFDAIFHLAAIHFIPYCNQNPQETIQVNIEGTYTLFENLNMHQCKNVFFASTAAVYGPSPLAHKETDVPAPMDIYGATKLSGEALIPFMLKKHQTPYVIGRLFNAYGPRETNPHLIPAVMDQILQSKKNIRVGNLSPKRDYIHTADLAEAIAQLTFNKASKAGRIVNIGTGHEHSVKTVLKLLSSVAPQPFSYRSLPSLQRRSDRPFLRAHTGQLKRLLPKLQMRTLKQGLRDLTLELT